MKRCLCAIAALLCLSGSVFAADSQSDLEDFLTYDEELAGQMFRVESNVGCVFEFQVNEGGLTDTLVSGDAKGAESLSIPGHVRGLGTDFQVSSIGAFAFRKYGDKKSPLKGVKRLQVEEDVFFAGQKCFEGAPDLEEVILPSTLERIGDQAFGSCPMLTTVRIGPESQMRAIGNFAFENCALLKEFEIPANVEDIGDAPWRGCKSMETIGMSEDNFNFMLQDGVLYDFSYKKLIQYLAGCRNNSCNVTFGTEVIGNSAFYGNPYIQNVWFPASVDMVEHSAFFDCRSLRSVTFNDSVRFIGDKAFAGCPELKEVTLYGTPEYTCNPGDPGNTFGSLTKVDIARELPEIKLVNSVSGILTSVREYVGAMPLFMTIDLESNEDYGFPEEFGKGTASFYGNAGPRKDVLRVLEK